MSDIWSAGKAQCRPSPRHPQADGQTAQDLATVRDPQQARSGQSVDDRLGEQGAPTLAGP